MNEYECDNCESDEGVTKEGITYFCSNCGSHWAFTGGE